MNQAEREMAQEIKRIMHVGFLAQAQRVRNQWEPKVRGVLTNAADALEARLAPMISEMAPGRTETERVERLRQAVRALANEIAARQTAAALRLLKEMVGRETTELLGIMTMEGLTQEIPTLDLLEMEDRELARRLAGGPPLEESVDKSLAELLSRLEEVTGGLDQPSAAALLERHLAWWRSRLAMIAATVTHAIFNRAKLAACAGLR